MAGFLADTSVWILTRLHPALDEKLRRRAGRDELAISVPVALELLHGARDGDEYEEMRGKFDLADWAPLTAAAAERALEVQRSLAQTTHGAHRIPALDYLVAAVAETSEAVMWHADRDLARLCEHTGQPHEYERVPRKSR